MANTAFDPLSLDPFATVNDNAALITFETQPVSEGNKVFQPLQDEDILMQFVDSAVPRPSSSQPLTLDMDVRKTRKQRIINHSSGSVASTSSFGSSSRKSNFAPPPDIPIPRDYGMSLFNISAEPDVSTQPMYEKITHSGSCLSRISNRTKILKVWKQVFWIIYEDRELLVFKSKEIFDEWLMNPYLSKNDRNAMVKLHVDFQCLPG